MLLAALITFAGGADAFAGKKRRNAVLEGLRQRDASQRWQQLQDQWQPLPTNNVVTPTKPDSSTWRQAPPQPTTTAPVDQSPSSTTQFKVTPLPAVNARQSPIFVIPGTMNESTATTVTNVSEPQVESREPAVVTPPTPTQTYPVWFLADEDPASKDDTKRDTTTDDDGDDADSDAGNRRLMQASASARPKPITSILPYYDYSPSGESPCEFLCPRPDGCPADKQGAKPCPEMVALPDVPFESRSFQDLHVTWEASNLFANPLYFEDASLERYGHTHHQLLQPFMSLGKFGVQLVGLPYQMALHSPHEHRYALGWYRPGECAPYKYYLPPWNKKAALTAGAAYTGLIFIIP